MERGFFHFAPSTSTANTLKLINCFKFLYVMRLKSFTDKTMTAAMQQVRDMLGEDAIIVSTREENGSVRVTAAIEEDLFRRHQDAHEAAPIEEEEEEDLYVSEDTDEEGYSVQDDIIDRLMDILLRHNVQADVTDQIVSCASVLENGTVYETMRAALEHLYAYQPLPVQSNGEAYIMVGPPGAGKTLATAKLASRAVLNGQSVRVFTADTVRAGGYEQLQAFTKILGIDLISLGTADELKKALAAKSSAHLTLIDTWGVNPFHAEDMKLLARFMHKNVEPVLVMAAGGDAAESAEIARVFSLLGVKKMLPTRLDIARRLGGLLEAAYHGRMAFTDAGVSPDVADGLTGVTPDSLCDMFMPRRQQNHSAAAGDKMLTTRKTG